jgi:hypothetical protein
MVTSLLDETELQTINPISSTFLSRVLIDLTFAWVPVSDIALCILNNALHVYFDLGQVQNYYYSVAPSSIYQALKLNHQKVFKK